MEEVTARERGKRGRLIGIYRMQRGVWTRMMRMSRNDGRWRSSR